MRPGKYRKGDRVLIVHAFGMGYEILSVCPTCDDDQAPSGRRKYGASVTPGECQTGLYVCDTCDGWGALRVAS